MERRKFLGLAAATGAAAGGAFTAAGCGIGTGTQSAALKVIAADYGEPGRGDSSPGYWERLVREFHNRHPGIAVDVEVNGWKDVDRKVAAMVDAGRPPDIAQIGAYADFAAKGLLYRAGELLSIPVQADFLPPLAEAGEVRQVQYGMPFVASTRPYSLTSRCSTGVSEPSIPALSTRMSRASQRCRTASASFGIEVPSIRSSGAMVALPPA